MDENTKKGISSIEALPDQCQQAWDESRKVGFPEEYKSPWNVAVCGMGASGLPVDVVKSVFPTNVPLELVQSYDLPSWVGNKTLVVLSSYSGETEEVLSCAEQAAASGALLAGITTGGKLAEVLSHHGYPGYVFEPRHNPSAQPRFGLGYMIFSLLGILAKTSVITETVSVEEGIRHMRQNEQKISAEAEEFTAKVKEKGMLVFAADHLSGNARIFANQLNETAKTFATAFTIPAANHHLLEGLKYPKENLVGVFLESSNYSDKMKKRFELTQAIVEKNGFSTYRYKLQKHSLVSEMLETLFFSSMASLQLALLYNEDPLETPWVDYFKEELSK